MKKILISYSCLLIVISGCSQVSKSKEENKQQGKQPNIKGVVLRLTKHEVMDNEGTGMVASTYLLPQNWRAEDKLYWQYNDPTVPIRYKGLLQSGDGTMVIQSFPDVRASYGNGPSGTYGYRPPNDIIYGMKDLIKAERKGKNIQYVDEKILSNTPQNGYQQGAQVKALNQTGVIRIEYDDNGQRYEEEFYGQLDISDIITQTALGNSEGIIWGASSMYACKAPKGKLDDCRKIAQTIKSSARLTLPFYNKLSQVMQLLSNQSYQQIFQAGQISKIISQTNDQMIANIDASYNQTQKAYDKINNNFSDYMRGVDRYSDGGTQVQLPSGYSNAWENDRGEYILTNTQGYNPGTEFNGNWKPLQKN